MGPSWSWVEVEGEPGTRIVPEQGRGEGLGVYVRGPGYSIFGDLLESPSIPYEVPHVLKTSEILMFRREMRIRIFGAWT